MIQPANLSRVRFGLRALFVAHTHERVHRTPGLHHLLPIPLPERLILLAVIDGASERDIRRTLKVDADDAGLKSRRMRGVVSRWGDYLSSPFDHFPEVWTRADLTPDSDLTTIITHQESTGVEWNRRYGAQLEAHLGRLLWADVAVALLGHSVPPEIGSLSLRTRLMLYCVLVAGETYADTAALLRGTPSEVERSVEVANEALEGCYCPVCAHQLTRHTFDFETSSNRLSCPANRQSGSYLPHDGIHDMAALAAKGGL